MATLRFSVLRLGLSQQRRPRHARKPALSLIGRQAPATRPPSQDMQYYRKKKGGESTPRPGTRGDEPRKLPADPLSASTQRRAPGLEPRAPDHISPMWTLGQNGYGAGQAWRLLESRWRVCREVVPTLHNEIPRRGSVRRRCCPSAPERAAAAPRSHGAARHFAWKCTLRQNGYGAGEATTELNCFHVHDTARLDRTQRVRDDILTLS